MTRGQPKIGSRCGSPRARERGSRKDSEPVTREQREKIARAGGKATWESVSARGSGQSGWER